jgi:hypothetical protein
MNDEARKNVSVLLLAIATAALVVVAALFAEFNGVIAPSGAGIALTTTSTAPGQNSPGGIRFGKGSTRIDIGKANNGLVELGDGSATAPALTFWNGGDGDTGLYRAGANDLGVTAGGTKAAEFVSDGMALPQFVEFTPGTTISVTNGASFTPTATLQPIQSAGSVTPTLSVTNSAGSAYAAGTLLRLLNISATTIVLADSGTVKLAGAWTAGQYDSLTLIFDATTSTWIEIGRSDN